MIFFEKNWLRYVLLACVSVIHFEYGMQPDKPFETFKFAFLPNHIQKRVIASLISYDRTLHANAHDLRNCMRINKHARIFAHDPYFNKELVVQLAFDPKVTLFDCAAKLNMPGVRVWYAEKIRKSPELHKALQEKLFSLFDGNHSKNINDIHFLLTCGVNCDFERQVLHLEEHKFVSCLLRAARLCYPVPYSCLLRQMISVGVSGTIGRSGVVAQLVTEGAVTRCKGHATAQEEYEDFYSLLEEFLKAGANPNIPSPFGQYYQTAFGQALLLNNSKMIDILLKYGACPKKIPPNIRLYWLKEWQKEVLLDLEKNHSCLHCDGSTSGQP